MPDKSDVEYDLVEWQYEPFPNETKKLDMKTVISGEENGVSYLILLASSPDGFYHFNVSHFLTALPIKINKLKYGAETINATVFNIKTVSHQSTCDCLEARNLISESNTLEIKNTPVSSRLELPASIFDLRVI